MPNSPKAKPKAPRKRGPKPTLDWDAIEADYRTGSMSMSAIARKHGCAVPTISVRAKRDKWKQDLADEVRRRTTAALANATPESPIDREEIAKTALLDTRLEAAVATNLAVVRTHRGILAKAQDLVARNFARLASVPEQDPTKQARAQASIIKDLSIAVRNLVPLERQAHNLDAQSGDLDAPDAVKVTFYRKADK